MNGWICCAYSPFLDLVLYFVPQGANDLVRAELQLNILSMCKEEGNVHTAMYTQQEQEVVEIKNE